MYTLSEYVDIPNDTGEEVWFHPITGMTIGLNDDLKVLAKFLSGDIDAAQKVENELQFSPEFMLLFQEELLYRGFLIPQNITKNEQKWHQELHPFKRPNEGFFQMPVALLEALPSNSDLVFFGVPYDDAATHPGCRYGPSLLRGKSISYSFRSKDHKGIYSLGENEPVIAKYRCFDIGDLQADEIGYEERLNLLKDKIEKLPEQAIPIMIGGDHSYTYATVSAVCKRNDGKPLILVQFDSHLDLQVWSPQKKGEVDPIRHSNFVTHLLNENPTLNVVQAGIRHFQSVVSFDNNIPDLPGYRTSIISDLSMALNSEEVISKVGIGNDIYISLDVDCLRKINNTGYPAAMGLSIETLMLSLYKICMENRVQGIDIMEFGANKNHDQHAREAELVNYILLCCLEWIK